MISFIIRTRLSVTSADLNLTHHIVMYITKTEMRISAAIYNIDYLEYAKILPRQI